MKIRDYIDWILKKIDIAIKIVVMDSEIYRYIDKKKTLLTLDEHFVSPRSQVLFYELFMT